MMLNQLTLSSKFKMPMKVKKKALAADETDFSKLKDPKYAKTLEKLYSKYENLKPMWQTLADMWANMHIMMNGVEFQRLGISNPDAQAFDIKAVTKTVKDAMSEPDNYIFVDGNEVELRIRLPQIVATIGYGSSTSSRDEAARNLKDVERLIKYLVPQFALPDRWRREFDPDENRRYVTVNLPSLDSPLRTVEDYHNLNPRFYTPSRWNGPSRFDYSGDFLDRFGGMVYFKTAVPENSVELRSVYIRPDTQSGYMEGISGTLVVPINITAYIRFPLEYALWATCVTDPNEFNVKLFVDFINSWRQYDLASGVKPYHRTSSVKSVKQENSERLAVLQNKPKPRLNKEGFAILRNAMIMHIPLIDNVDEYEKASIAAYDKESKTVDIKEQHVRRNWPIYTDWLNDRFVYSNSNGNIEQIDLTGCKSLDAITISEVINKRIYEDGNRDMFDPITFWRVLSEAEKRFGVLDIPQQTNNMFENLISLVIHFYTELVADPSIPDIKFMHIADPESYPQGGLDEEKHQTYIALLKLMREVVEKLSFNKDDMPCALVHKLQSVYLGFEIILNYGTRAKEYFDIRDAMFKKNEPGQYYAAAHDKIFTIPNLASFNTQSSRGFMPHQAEAVNAVYESNAKHFMLAIAPGGGKTLTMISLMMLILSRGDIKRPVLVVPNSLVKEICSEINKFSAGKINAVPLTVATIDKMRTQLGFNKKQIIAYLKGLPKNTLLVTSYNFLHNRRDIETGQVLRPKIYANSILTPYPKLELLSEVGVDAVIGDETQYIKNLESKASKSYAKLAAQAEVLGGSTGTRIKNNPTDLVGQTNPINPAIFVSVSKFTDTFASETNAIGKGIAWAGNEAEIGRRIRMYALDVVKKSNEWSHMLPKVDENIFIVDAQGLTGKQRAFYNDLLDQAKSRIKDNKILEKYMNSGNPEDDKKVEQALKLYFANVEQFVNAPDSNEAFMAQPDLSEDDKRSPKVTLINQLVNAHFNGGSVQEVNFNPDPNKIIIFCYNRSVSKHIYEHLDAQSMAVHYTAGDEDALNNFRNLSHIKILVADETSIKEGFNLQVASHIIKIQSVWSPGDDEQTWRRVVRPDPDNVYNRDEIKISRIIIDETVEVAKMARLISRIIDRARVEYANISEMARGRLNFPEDKLDNLGLIPMNLRSIDKYSKAYSPEMEEYRLGYATLMQWENEQNARAKAQLIQQVERRIGRKIRDNADLIANSVVKIDGTTELSGSKKAYVPWVAGMTPHDPHGLNLVPIASIIESDDDDEETEDEQEEQQIDIVAVEPGDLVITEFGYGRIDKVYTNQLNVVILGMNRTMKLKKSVVFIPGTETGRKQLQKIVKQYGKNGENAPILIRPVDSHPGLVDDSNADNIPATVGEPQERPEVEVEVSLLNELPCLIINGPANDQVLAAYGWKTVPAFLMARTRNAQGFKDLVNHIISDKSLKIPDTNINMMKTVLKKMKQGPDALMRFQHQNINKNTMDLKNFFRRIHKPDEANQLIVKLYPIIWDGQVYLCVNATTHSQKALRRLTNIKPTGNYTRFTLKKDMKIFFFKSKVEAGVELQSLSRFMTVTNMDQAKASVKELPL